MLKLDELHVESFNTSDRSSMAAGPGGGFCCTGCTSGCGINPTAGGCESNGGKTTFYPAEPQLAE